MIISKRGFNFLCPTLAQITLDFKWLNIGSAPIDHLVEHSRSTLNRLGIRDKQVKAIHSIRLERLARDKQPNLLGPFISHEESEVL
jgi:hypothetical protein